MKNNKLTQMDPHQMQRAMYDEDNDAQRVSIVQTFPSYLEQQNLEVQEHIFAELKLINKNLNKITIVEKIQTIEKQIIPTYLLLIMGTETFLILSYLMHSVLNRFFK